MTENKLPSLGFDEARAALADVDRVLTETKLAIAQGPTAPLLVIWGGIWLAANAIVQFDPSTMRWIWWVLNAVGMAASFWVAARHRVQVRQPGGWRIGIFWGALVAYATLWMLLLMPAQWLERAGDTGLSDPALRRLCTFWHTIPMFGYVVMGLWLGSFFIWLGLAVTALVLVGYVYAGAYLYLWLGVAGGGALIISGVFIRKFWK